jgi:hypothetical protein
MPGNGRWDLTRSLKGHCPSLLYIVFVKVTLNSMNSLLNEPSGLQVARTHCLWSNYKDCYNFCNKGMWELRNAVRFIRGMAETRVATAQRRYQPIALFLHIMSKSTVRKLFQNRLRILFPVTLIILWIQL